MSERVSLPDPSAQRLLHPVDVVGARPAYARGWAMSVVASPEVLTLVAALAWLLSGSWVAPTLAVLSTGVVAELARRHLMDEAWAHVPRKRQDRTRDTPAPYAHIEAAARPVALATAVLLLLLTGLADQDAGVRSWALGSAAGVGVLLVGVPLGRWWRIRSAASALGTATGLVAVAAACLVYARTDGMPDPVDGSALLLGLGMVVVTYATALVGRRLRSLGSAPA